MATNAIISASNLDISKVTFGDIRVNKAGGKSVPIKYNGQNLQIRIPKMEYRGGLKVKVNETTGTAYNLTATMKGCDPYATARSTTGDEIGNLYNFLLDLQNRLLKFATENSIKWFGKARKEDVIADTMKPFIGPSVEQVNGVWTPTGKYPPGLRMKVPVYNGDVSMSVVDHAGKAIVVDTDNITQIFPKNVEASIVVAPSVYVTGQGFGVTWRIAFVRVSPPQRLTAADVFADEIEASSHQVQEEVTVPVEEETHVEEEGESHVEEAAPPPAPVKNRRRIVAST
jgi:hypothetical protein